MAEQKNKFRTSGCRFLCRASTMACGTDVSIIYSRCTSTITPILRCYPRMSTSRFCCQTRIANSKNLKHNDEWLRMRKKFEKKKMMYFILAFLKYKMYKLLASEVTGWTVGIEIEGKLVGAIVGLWVVGKEVGDCVGMVVVVVVVSAPFVEHKVLTHI